MNDHGLVMSTPRGNIMNTKTYRSVLSGMVLLCITAGTLEAKTPQQAELTPTGEKLKATYQQQLNAARQGVTSKLPRVDERAKQAFLTAHQEEKGKPPKDEKKADDPRNWKDNTYNQPKREFATMAAAEPVLSQVDALLSQDTLDDDLVLATVIAQATPEGLAAFAQQSPQQAAMIHRLLSDPALMKQMLYAGGAKAGRYGKAMEILTTLEQQYPRTTQDGVFRRLALASALEFAAPDTGEYKDIDPIQRYAFYEKSYLDGKLDKFVDQHPIWLLRQVINDPQTEEDMAWMQDMLRNYRPDMINAPDDFRGRVAGLMYSEFGHKRPEWDDNSPRSRLQQAIDRGGQCGPKAFFGRCLTRSFGVPTWGARLRSHTAMTYWTPKGWTTILGISWQNGFWIVDTTQQKRASMFKLEAMAREIPEAFTKAKRAEWIGLALQEEPVDGMYAGTGGFWNALALNQMRNAVNDKFPAREAGKRPWAQDTYEKDETYKPEEVMQVNIESSDRQVTTDSEGRIRIPAVATATPTMNTAKIVFMKDLEGQPLLHYKRYEQPEPFTYTVNVPRAGRYELTADVVTVNREQFFDLTTNREAQPKRLQLPYTFGYWQQSDPIILTLEQGENTLTFNRTAPDDFVEKGWSRAGPEYGGITVRQFVLSPKR